MNYVLLNSTITNEDEIYNWLKQMWHIPETNFYDSDRVFPFIFLYFKVFFMFLFFFYFVHSV